MDFYIIENSFKIDLENLPLLNLNELYFSNFVSLMTYLSYYFLLDASIFTTIDEKKEEQKSTLQIFLKDVTEEKDLEIHQHS